MSDVGPPVVHIYNDDAPNSIGQSPHRTSLVLHIGAAERT